MTEHPLLSIFVPTRNRAKYAISTMKSVLACGDPRLQLVVQDNSESNELAQMAESLLGDARLVFLHIPERLSLAQNFIQALEACTGEYVTCLGDDDGANPEVIDAALWARANNVDLLTATRTARYAWPDHKTKYLQEQLAGRLDLEPFDGTFLPLDIEAELKRCLAFGGLLGATRLAGVYRGIVRRSALEKVRSQIGTYYPGPSPDLACTIALTSVVKKAVQVNYPLFVPGASGASAHAMGRPDSSELRIENKLQFESEMLDRWSPLVPKYYLSASIWGETAVQALRAIGRDDLFRELNLPFIHAQCATKAPQLTVEIFQGLRRALKANEQSVPMGQLQFALEYGRFFTMRLQSLHRSVRAALFPRQDTTALTGLPDIEAAVRALSETLHAQGRSFKGVSS